ncbi:MAG: ribonuclease H-like domain-containing protein [Cetobacterium sp.]
MRILLLDIETAPNLAHVWGIWQQNIAPNQLLEASYVLCWAAKWLDEPAIFFDSIHRSPPKQMLKRIHALLDEADSVIHYNGTKFDIPTINKEFLLYGMTQPAPYKQMDLLKVTRQQFKFPSNKLDYIAQALGVGKKVKHEGHELWLKCMDRDANAWVRMERYNKGDVKLLERVYHRLLPWMRTHTNQSVFEGREQSCPNCGSSHHQARGWAYTNQGRYRRFQCTACRSWFRSTKNEVCASTRYTSL